MTNIVLLDPSIVESDEPRPFVVWKEWISRPDTEYERKFKIQDASSYTNEELIQFFKTNLYHSNTMAMEMGVNTSEEAEIFRSLLTDILNGNSSLVCIDDETKELIGLAIVGITSNDYYFWPQLTLHTSGNKKSDFLKDFLCYAIKYSEVSKKFNTSTWLHVFYCVVVDADQDMKNYLKEVIIETAMDMGRYLNLSLLTFLATNSTSRRAADYLYMDAIFEINEAQYTNIELQNMFELNPDEPFSILYAIDLNN